MVGAGIAGLACAARLAASGITVMVFDKGRSPGGRIATRRLDGIAFDHGAQFAATRGPGFANVLAELEAEGVVAVWPAASEPDARRFVGVPGMSALPTALAGRLSPSPLQGRHVSWLDRAADGWRLRWHAADSVPPGAVGMSGGELAGPFDTVVVATPSPQAAALLATTDAALAGRAASATYAPCWAVMAAFDQPLAAPDTDRRATGPIGWAARESSRPGRAGLPERFVIHASTDWSRAHLEEPPETIAALLLAAFGAPTPTAAMAHRWRHALVEHPLGEPCLWDGAIRLGACGDWCLGGRVEAAWDSGQAMAEAVLAAG